MKRNVFNFMAMFFVAVLTLGFTSCGDDDDDDSNGSGGQWGNVPAEVLQNLQGTWDFYSGTSTTMGYTANLSRADVEEIGRQMNFSFWDLTMTFTSSTVNGVRYSVQGDKLIIEGADVVEGFDIRIKSLTESTLVLRESFSLNGTTFSCDLTYKKR